MRVVITGATGNLGTALVRRLSARDELTAVTRRRPPDTAPYLGMDWVRCDVGGPDATAELTAAFAGADAVVHLAWQLQPGYPDYRREPMRRTNVDGTAAVAQAVLAAGVPHLVHVSSLGAYAPAHDPRLPVGEDHPVTGVPSSPYSRDKVAAEQLLDGYEDRLRITRLRPTLILQPDAASEIARYFLGPLFGARLSRRAIRPATLRLLPFPPEVAVQLVHADDVATAIDLVISRQAGGAFNVAAEPVIDRAGYAELAGGVGPALPVRALRALTAASWAVRLQPTEPGWVDLARQVPLLATDRLRALGWEPQHDGTHVLRDFLRALREGRGGDGALLQAKEG